MGVEGKTCVVTGAAQGIGRGIALDLAAKGAAVVVADLNEKKAEAVAEEARSKDGRAIAVPVDVTKRDQVRAVVERTVDEFGRLDVYFNNAGMNKPMPFLEVTEDNWESILRVNGLGVLIGMQEAAKRMIAQGGGGKIVNTASIAGRQGYPAFAPYCASKFAVIALTQAGARALAEHRITVNGFAPGVVDTPLWEQLDADLMAMGESSKPGEAMEAFSEGILVGRAALPDDITGVTSFLASTESDYITGQIMMVDGGMVLV